MTSQKAPSESVRHGGRSTAIGGRRFTRSRGRTIRHDANTIVRRRDLEWIDDDREADMPACGILCL